MPVKIFATGTRRRREKCHQSERMFRPAGSQAHALPGSRSCWSIHLVDHLRCVCVGQRGRNAALIVHPALLGDTNRDGVVAPGTVGELHCLVGC